MNYKPTNNIFNNNNRIETMSEIDEDDKIFIDLKLRHKNHCIHSDCGPRQTIKCK